MLLPAVARRQVPDLDTSLAERFRNVDSLRDDHWNGGVQGSDLMIARVSSIPLIALPGCNTRVMIAVGRRALGRINASLGVRGCLNGPGTNSPDYRMLDFGDRITVRSNAQSPQVDFFRRAFETMRGK
jgi:hypothetical protein